MRSNEEIRKEFLDNWNTDQLTLKHDTDNFFNRSIISKKQRKPIRKKNKKALLSFEVVAEVRKKASKLIQKEKENFSADENEIFNLIKSTLQLARPIRSCDLPDDIEEDELMVSFVQKHIDALLKKDEYSWLSKIIQSAIHIKKEGYGNCMEKAFFAFAVMFKHLSDKGQPFSLELSYFDNHFLCVITLVRSSSLIITFFIFSFLNMFYRGQRLYL